MADKQQRQKAQKEIHESLAMIASLGSNIEHYLPDLAGDPAALELVSNRLAEDIGTLRDIYSQIGRTRFEALLPGAPVIANPDYLNTGEGIDR